MTQCALPPLRSAELSAFSRHVDFANVLEGFGCCQAWITAFGNGGFGFVSASAGRAKGDGGICAKGETTTLVEGVMERPTLAALANSQRQP